MDGYILGLIIGLCGGFALGCVFTNIGPNREQEAIEKGYARYNPKTGDWEWIEPTECGHNG